MKFLMMMLSVLMLTVEGANFPLWLLWELTWMIVFILNAKGLIEETR